MSLSRRALVALFYGTFVLVVLTAGFGVLARNLAPLWRLVPMVVAYLLLILVYRLWLRSPHYRPRLRRTALWTRLAQRLFVLSDADLMALDDDRPSGSRSTPPYNGYNRDLAA